MISEIKTMVSAKFQHLPDPLQHHLDEVFLRFVEKKDQREISMGIFKSIMNSVEFIIEMDENEGYVLGINYSPSSASVSSIPTWRIVCTKGILEKEVSQIDKILEWIFESHPKIITSSDLPKFYSSCHEKKVVFTGLNGQSIFLPVHDIIYLSAEGDFTRVFYGHTKEHKSVLVDLSMGCAEIMMLPYSFFRIHRSYMVNLGCIRNIDTASALPNILLCSGTELPLARRRRIALLERINSLGSN